MITGGVILRAAILLALSLTGLGAWQSFAQASTCEGSASGEMTQQYCDAGKSADAGAKADQASSAVWGGVAAVCGGSCFTPVVGQTVCQASYFGGIAAQGALTRNFGQALQEIANPGTIAAGAGLLKSQATKAEAPADKSSSKSKAACGIAAQAGLKSLQLQKTAKEKKNIHDKSIAQAEETGKEVPVGIPVGLPEDSGTLPGGSPSADSAGIGQSGGNPTSKPKSKTAAAIAKNCGTLGDSPAASLIIQCARAADPSLPPMIASPEFERELAKQTGESLTDLYKGLQKNPKNALLGAMGHGLDPGKSRSLDQLVAAVDKVTDAPSAETAGSESAASGSGPGKGAASGNSDMPNIDELLSKILADGDGTGDAESDQSGMRAVIQANSSRQPASIAENNKLSIFDRVTFRYQRVSRRLGAKGTEQ